MKILNERDKHKRNLAMQTLNIGDDISSKMSKKDAKKFLKDLGFSDEKIAEIEGKGKGIKESSLNEEHIIKGVSDIKHAQEILKKKNILFNGIKNSDNGNKEFYYGVKNDKGTKNLRIGYFNPNKKELVITEEIQVKINSPQAAEGQLRAKNLQWNKVEKEGTKTVWKKDNVVVGAFDPSWGTVRTGEDLLK